VPNSFFNQKFQVKKNKELRNSSQNNLAALPFHQRYLNLKAES